MSSFKAYIGVDEYDSQGQANNVECNGFDARSGLRLLSGEVIISSAHSVLKFAPLSNRQGISGALFVTNFKVGFVTADQSSYQLVDRTPQNNFLGECDICLANIENAYQVLENGRKKRLIPGSSINYRIELLQLHCKDFRVLNFSFKFSPLGQEKAIINSILHHAFSPRVQLLFAFEYKGPVTHGNNVGGTLLFNVACDWLQELQRLKCEDTWRVSHLNEHYMVSKSLPEIIVIPSSILDKELTSIAFYFRGHRLPIWSWSKPDGCAIVRSTGIHPGISDTYQMDVLSDYIKLTHPLKKNPYIVELDSMLPSLKDIQQSYVKLRELCMPDSASQFWEQDNHFYSLLDNTKWLHTIANFLSLSKELATYIIRQKAIVILQETTGRDLSCVISSLIQIILDPHYRTVTGFQSLIQKEWIAMGHPFSDRLKLLRSAENEECPVFLAFLDCIWQMMQQFPSAFEFTETYLTILWDCSHLSIFDTFLFNSCWDRYAAHKEEANPLPFRSLWEWNRLLPKEDIVMFYNPLYVMAQLNATPSSPSHAQETHNVYKTFPRSNSETLSLSTSTSDNSRQLNSKDYSPLTHHSLNTLSKQEKTSGSRRKNSDILLVNSRCFDLQLWNHCYLRWIPLAQIHGGGTPAVYLQRYNLLKEILQLQNRFSSFTKQTLVSERLNHVLIDSSYSTLKIDDITSSFPYSPGGSPSMYGLPLSFYRHSSYVASDDELNSDDLQSFEE